MRKFCPSCPTCGRFVGEVHVCPDREPTFRDLNKQLYWVWAAMLCRCGNTSDKGYMNYGGRGIEVCERWHDFELFMKDMGSRPKGALLDRRNNDGNYEPGNCRWVNRKEQNSNRRICIFVSVDGEEMILKDACKTLGISYSTVQSRRNIGWSIIQAMVTPIESRRYSCLG